MSRLDDIEVAGARKPLRALIYGIEGVGKTSLLAKAPNPIFITPEGGTDQIRGAKKFKNVKTWEDVIACVDELLVAKHDYKTLAIDTADWLEKICHALIIQHSKGKSIITANGGYGAGYSEAERMHRELIAKLDRLRDECGMNILVSAHYQVKIVKDPEAVQDYDQFEIKCHEKVSSLWREWAECLFFARFNTFIKVEDDKDRGRAVTDGRRTVYTVKTPAFQAKNRYGLPAEMEFSENFWNVLSGHIDRFYLGGGTEQAATLEAVRSEVKELLAKVQDPGLAKTAADHAEKVWTDVAQLTRARDRLKQVVPQTRSL